MFCTGIAAVLARTSTRSPCRASWRKAQSLHPAHAAPDHGIELVHAQRREQHHMRAHHVADGDDGKTHGIRLAIGGDAARTGGAHAAAQHIGADHMKAVRVDGQARPDHAAPPPRLAGDGMRTGHMLVTGGGVTDEDGIVARLIERAIGFIGDAHAIQNLPAIERQGLVKLVSRAGEGSDGLGHAGVRHDAARLGPSPALSIASVACARARSIMTSLPEPKSWISAIHAYVPGKSKGADGKPLIKLSANENPLGTSAAALEARALPPPRRSIPIPTARICAALWARCTASIPHGS
jgi:hypothetical protein